MFVHRVKWNQYGRFSSTNTFLTILFFFFKQFYLKVIHTTGMYFHWDYSIIPDIPQLSPEFTQSFPVYTQTSPDGNPWTPGLLPDIHWGIPSLPWLHPEIPWETHVNPEDTLTFPDGHPWWPELPPDIPWRPPDGPLYPLTSPEVWRCLSGLRNICFIIRKDRKCHKKCDIISEREIIYIDAFNTNCFTGSCVYHLFIYLFIHSFIYYLFIYMFICPFIFINLIFS